MAVLTVRPVTPGSAPFRRDRPISPRSRSAPFRPDRETWPAARRCGQACQIASSQTATPAAHTASPGTARGHTHWPVTVTARRSLPTSSPTSPATISVTCRSVYDGRVPGAT